MSDQLKTTKVREIELREREQLEPMLLRDLTSVEDGMGALDHQVRTDSGLIDILGADKEGTLVVIELKDELDDGQLDQGIEYYDWVASNVSLLARIYKGFDPNKPPRLILVAPDFSESVRRVAKYTSLSSDGLLEFKKYRALELPGGGIAIVCDDVEIEDRETGAIEAYALDDHLRKGTEAIREVCQQLRNEILKLDSQIREKVKKKYIAFETSRNFTEFVVQKNALLIYLDLFVNELNDERKIAGDCSDVGHWGTGKTRFKVESVDEVQYAMSLIRQSYERSLHR